MSLFEGLRHNQINNELRPLCNAQCSVLWIGKRSVGEDIKHGSQKRMTFVEWSCLNNRLVADSLGSGVAKIL